MAEVFEDGWIAAVDWRVELSQFLFLFDEVKCLKILENIYYDLFSWATVLKILKTIPFPYCPLTCYGSAAVAVTVRVKRSELGQIHGQKLLLAGQIAKPLQTDGPIDQRMDKRTSLLMKLPRRDWE